jgi:hypothetical protein
MRIILAIFPDRFEVYGSLKPFFEQYPQYAELKDKIDYTMSRKKLPFKHSDFKLQRLNVRRSLSFEEEKKEVEPISVEMVKNIFRNMGISI